MDTEKLLDDHENSVKEYLRKKRSDAGTKRESYKSILPTKYRSYVFRANCKSLAFELTVEDFDRLMSMSCVYCGSSSQMTIDRISSRDGYTHENVQPCCYDCNMMKHFISSENFVLQVKKIARHLNLSTPHYNSLGASV